MASQTSPELETESAPYRPRRRGRVMIVIVILILLAIFVPPFVNVNRYKFRVADAIGRALGRDVSVSSIELVILPRPGLALSNFVVADNSSYSPEPMLRAETVTAYPRLSSLWRGRLEIGTLELENPSLNLVRRPDGHWNLEELVERSSRAPSAPTKAQPASRLRFPYVEATAGRINFKLGEIKKAFALTEADFALWQDSENEWGLRLEARPMRTDVSISDTGTLKMEGRFQRASALRDTPLNLKVNFNKGQLGQITKLIYGRDRGWRGGASGTATLSGDPAALNVSLDAQVDDFRRYDIALGEALRLRVHCTGTYSSPDDSVRDVVCESPIKPGNLRVSGSAVNWGLDEYEVSVRAEQLPMERVMAFARHVKKDLPADLTAVGDAQAVFDVRKADGVTTWSGGGSTSHFALRSSILKDEVPIGELAFVIPGAQPEKQSGKKTKANAAKLPPPVAGFGIVMKPFALPLGAASPATATGYFDETNYRVTVSGEAELSRLVTFAHALGMATPGIGLSGSAELDIDVAGSWTGFAQPIPSGRLQLRKVTAELQGVSEPLTVQTATASLAEHEVQVAGLSAGFANGPQVAGTLNFPLHCTDPQTCVLHFDLKADELSVQRVNKLLNPRLSQPWYHLLAIGQRREDALLRLHANGRFAVARMEVGPLAASNVSGSLALAEGKVRVDNLKADLLGGHHAGTWSADFTSSSPQFSGEGNVSKLAVAQLAAIMKDNWGSGALDGFFKFSMNGQSPEQLRSSAAGSADFRWNTGTLRHVTLTGESAPLAFTKFAGVVELKDGKLVLSPAKIETSKAIYTVTGTAQFNRSLDFRLESESGQTYSVTGSVDKPRVEAVSSSQAQLQ